MKKRILSVLLAVTITISSFSSFAGQWKYDGNWYYLDDNGNYLKNQWVGNYYLGADGVMMTNSWTPDGYYVGTDGAWTGQSTNNISQATTQNDSISYMTSSGYYWGLTNKNEWINGNYNNPYIQNVKVNGNTLTINGTLAFRSTTESNAYEIRLEDGEYNFQLYSGTEYGESEDIWKPINKATFERQVAIGCGPALMFTVENGVVTEIGYTA